nr:DUF4843 domain-containing protein [uncultured Prevotella sp.]
MKKIFTNILLACAAMAPLAACSNVDYDGEYSSDGTYQSVNQAYFYFAQPEDSLLNYSFGVKSVDTLTHVVYVPVQLAGQLSGSKQTFSVKVGEGTTAVAGKHYTLNADTLAFAPNAHRAYVPVTLLRANLSEDKNDSIQLVLHLVGNDALGIRFTTNNTVKITFNNVLSKPDFWTLMETYWGLGPFTKNKYRKLLSYYNSDEGAIRNILEGTDATAQGYLYLRVQEVVAYFAAHPEEL